PYAARDRALVPGMVMHLSPHQRMHLSHPWVTALLLLLLLLLPVNLKRFLSEPTLTRRKACLRMRRFSRSACLGCLPMALRTRFVPCSAVPKSTLALTRRG